MRIRSALILIMIGLLALIPWVLAERFQNRQPIPPGRSEVVFWHFWGGTDKDVVDDVVARFNQSQQRYFVRAVAMPGNNLQAKLFLAVAGEDPPDVVNQDDPILPDWARRGVIQAMDEIADPEEVDSVRNALLDSAQRLSVFDERLFGVCNGLDIRALYYNQTALQSKELRPPTTIAELDRIAAAFTPATNETDHQTYGYLPDSRRLWAWGYVFGGDFISIDKGHGGRPDSNPDSTGHSSDLIQRNTVTLNTPAIQSALKWMTSYPRRIGADKVAAFRKGDQSLPGKTFPLMPILDSQSTGRYVCVMDGQWRVRDITEFQNRRRERGLTVPEFGVCPLPVPGDGSGRNKGGWVNGNFFVVPRGAKNTEGAWEFIKFWIGYSDPGEAAVTCAAGGWIPVTRTVIEHQEFQGYLDSQPLFKTFVELAASPNQFPIPQVPGAAMFRRTVENAAYEAMTHPEQPVEEVLAKSEQQIQAHLDRVLQSHPQRRPKSERQDEK